MTPTQCHSRGWPLRLQLVTELGRDRRNQLQILVSYTCSVCSIILDSMGLRFSLSIRLGFLKQKPAFDDID